MAKFGLLSLLLCSCIVIIAASPAQARTASTVSKLSKTDPLNTLLLQGFNWESAKGSSSWYNVLKGIVEDAADAGITDVWFPPPSQSLAPEGYLPQRLYDLNSSKYGSEQELRNAVDAFHQKGIGCVGDMVINHRSGTKQDDKGMWCVFEGGKGDGRLDWGPWAVTVNDKPFACGSGQADTGGDYAAAPDIDHTNPKIQQDLSEWMNWLKSNVGFDGWRFDFAKGYAGNLLAVYLKNTSPKFAVGEVWDDMSYSDGRLAYDQGAHRQRLVDWVHSTGDGAAAFDFTTKGILQEAVKSNELWRLKDSNGKPAGMIGVLPQKAVTFIDNHDTGSTQNIWPFPSDKLLQGYAYILTHPGIPTIFYDHFVDGNLKKEIQNLSAIRKRNNINANSNCRIITAESDLYMAAIDEKIVVKIGSRYDVGNLAPPSPEFRVVASGNGYCVWEKNSSPR
uniref:Alpha-amylase n=1 Tax=Picea sitchensis TaxID=3332 RepID=A9NUX3_PICSI|nr:unknown [Picea sitchensis]